VFPTTQKRPSISRPAKKDFKESKRSSWKHDTSFYSGAFARSGEPSQVGSLLEDPITLGTSGAAEERNRNRKA
jgi:hypothetical protein